MRLQLALNVADLDEAVDFYTKLFATEPLKVEPGYANFAVADPPLKLVLFENAEGAPGNGDFHHLNHLGVETTTADEVVDAERRIADAGIETTGVEEAICCYADKTETWMLSPEGVKWEWYVKNSDADQMEHETIAAGSGPAAADVGDVAPGAG